MNKKVANYFNLKDNPNDDLLLKKIHLRRLRFEVPNFLSEYLIETFLKTKDVRFFNEFLWLNDKEQIDHSSAITFFSEQVNREGVYNFCYDDSLKNSLKINGDENSIVDASVLEKSICLIGTPFHFMSAFLKFKKLKKKVDIVNVKYHQSKKIGFILNNKIMSVFYKLFFGSKNYFEIKITDKKQLKTIQLPKKYDVGFHKLSFIISDSLIQQFRLGLINDHWGALPLFKGRSTLAYSKLFGANLIITNHLVKKEIDAGEIIMYSAIDPKAEKKAIYLGLGDRIVKSIFLILSDKTKKDIDNSKGKIFYEMHPWLLGHLKK